MIAEPEISLDYTLTYKDFLAGQKLAVRKSLPLLLFHIVTRYIAFCAAVIFTLMAIINLASGHGDTVPGILPLIFLFFLMPAIFYAQWRFSFNRLKLTSAEDPRMLFQADGTSFSRQIHQMGDVTWLWSATDSMCHNKKVLLISARRGAYIIIPRKVVTDAQIVRLEGMLRENKETLC